MASAYDRLVGKVDAETATLSHRLRDSLRCRAGCASCCHVELTVAAVEADAIVAYLADAGADVRESIHGRADRRDGRCVMLDDDDLCSIFPVRPLVCRTQGLPLLYPHDVVPIEAVLARTDRGSITACPLNFEERKPTIDDAIDAARLDTMLGLVDHLDAEARGVSSRPRVALRTIATTTG